ncbi:hypothetical protein [Mycoplasma bradburyae]|uniref:Haemagglutinin Mycoplasma domain-containing protein n=1 Tax=Mycoplasma bradburyae TaxID=2963128 RepID=A0AAW6HRY3_9MOLU|nr:hypothetical protein [Mycoplasma bradburyae]MDC4183468.1 hypothetical protein [Mycoplasma bradburyae]
MKQKTKKLLQLSFSLGFLATTALVATSCNQPKTVTPKPTNPMQPGNGSETTPGTGETMQPGNGSGTGTTTSDNTEAKNQLKVLIDSKDTKLAMYDDYSMIKSKLANAYVTAKIVNDKTDATKDELTNAKTTLETAIATAASSKDKFDKDNAPLVALFKTLKDKVANKDSILSTLTEDNYIKTYITGLYTEATNIITAGLQPATALVANNLETLSNNIETSTSNLDMKKNTLDEYSNYKKILVDSGTFKGDTLYNKTSPDNQSIVAFSSDFDNSNMNYQWRTARRLIHKEDKAKSLEVTSVGWIYNLNSMMGDDKKAASYDLDFNYYSGSSAKLYFPYKAAKTEQASDVQNKLSLKYKLNNKEAVAVNLDMAKVDGIAVAKIDLTDLNFGKNTISFTTDADKAAPMIGNFYITNADKDSNVVYNDIFGNEYATDNLNKITVNLVKGYGLANKGIGVMDNGNDASTDFSKLTGKLNDQGENKDYYLLGYLGLSNPVNSEHSANEKYYTFYVNAPKAGVYDISGIYNSGSNVGLTFWVDTFNNNMNNSLAKFKNLMFGRWEEKKLNVFDSNKKFDNMTPTSLNLKAGLNKIIVSGLTGNQQAPNLVNVTFTLHEQNPSANTEMANH